ncbi:MAG TPA: DNA cytosine methyltransferase [Elusimicrobiota bacterium]|nr:DNA cytosine methyltransferase [Elusimicrobiota bacterium]
MDEVRRLTPLECERLQGFPDSWTQVDMKPLDAELSDSLRYHALGNAVSVPVVRWIAERIHGRMCGRREWKRGTMSRREFPNKALAVWPGLQGPNKIAGELLAARKTPAKIVWPNSGVLWNGIFLGNRTPPAPHKPVASDLLEIIEKNRPHDRYFLSANAAEGILRRVDGQERHLFPPLRLALEKLSGRKPSAYEPMLTSSQIEMRLADKRCVSR